MPGKAAQKLKVIMSNVSASRIFLLGVGAQKAGTTWLHDYLSNHPKSNFGFKKEYHVFDSLCFSDSIFFEGLLRRGKGQIERLEKSLTDDKRFAASGNRKSNGTFRLLEFLYDHNSYFDYFAELYHQDVVTLAGDITPSYCGLEPSVFQLIKESFQLRGITVKVIFLMRDPVERFVSLCQMRGGRRSIDQAGFDKIVSTWYKGKGSEYRGRYDLTVRNLETVFDPGDLHYEFYERLFRRESIGNICEFLGVNAVEAALEKKINPSSVKMTVSTGVRRDVRAHFAPVYDFMYSRYSKSVIDSIWKSAAE